MFLVTRWGDPESCTLSLVYQDLQKRAHYSKPGLYVLELILKFQSLFLNA